MSCCICNQYTDGSESDDTKLLAGNLGAIFSSFWLSKHQSIPPTMSLAA